MRTYLILKEKVERFNADPEIQQILSALIARGGGAAPHSAFSPERAATLKSATFDLDSMRQRGFAYERLDQLTIEILLGVR
jgi:xylose isomerase